MTTHLMRRTYARAGLLVVAGLAMAALGLPSPAEASVPARSGSWPYPNGDIANTRDALGSTIASTNVSQLKEAWSFKVKPSTGVGLTGSLVSNPVVRDGVVYLQDLDSNVYALSLVTGKQLWEFRVGVPVKSGPGPNGVAVAGGTVFGASPTSVFALNAATGRTVWVNRDVLTKGQGTFGIQPQVADGTVYLGSDYGSGAGGGVLLALKASTGKVLWKFNTILRADSGVQAVDLGSGGAWQTPLVGSDGSITFGIGNPYQTPASAIAHPSAQLYTDSDVNLNAATGKLRWYYQGVTNDFKDYDMQASPISASINGVPAVLGGGKMGYVYAMNAETGRLIWKTPVGKHNGHDNDSRKLLEHKGTLKTPYTILPGSIGGVLTNMALAGSTVYLVTNDLPFTYKSLDKPLVPPSGSATGEVEALNLATGKVEWDTKVPDLPLGAATVSNDLVFTTLVNGVLVALNATTGAIVYRHSLPAGANPPIAIAGNTVLVPAGGVGQKHPQPQLVAYSVP
jgi:outer membrane protein assembly factor BamB